MSDIIDRLRSPVPSIPAMRDAASEIERLRRTLRDALETLEKYHGEGIPPMVVGLFIRRFHDDLKT